MKIYYRILAIMAAAAFAVACDPNKTPEFNDEDAFASFDKASFAFNETAGTISIPVTVASINPLKTSVTYEVDTEKSTAVVGEDFSFADNTGVLAFSGSERTKTIDIKLEDKSGIYTGDKSIVIKLKSAVGVNVGAENSCRISILDLDHPLADILGDYTVTCTDYYNGAVSYTMTLSKDPDDITIVWCNALAPVCLTATEADGPMDCWGKVSEDHSTITFEIGQKPGADFGYGSMVLCEWYLQGGGLYVNYSGDPIVLTKTADGTFTTDFDTAFVDDEYVWRGGLILGKKWNAANGTDYVTTWTKK